MTNIPDGCTVLHAACHAGNVEVVSYLLGNHVMFVANAADDDDDDDDDAIEAGDANVNADAKATNAKTKTDKKKGNNNRIIMLDLNEIDLQGRTALHIAAGQCHAEIITLLKGGYEKLQEEWERMEYGDSESSSDEEEDDEKMIEGIDEKKDEEASNRKEKVDATLCAMIEKLTMADHSLKQQQQQDDISPPTVEDKATTSTTTTAAVTPRTNKLSTKQQSRSSKTPKSSKRSPKRRISRNSKTPKTPMSARPRLSPKGLPLSSPPTYNGSTAPLDLSGRSPLGCAATSTASNAKKNRTEVEQLLYAPGDPSIVGHGGRGDITPPKDRCGPKVQYRSPYRSPLRSAGINTPASSKRVAFEDSDDESLGGGTINSYLSPTPHKMGNSSLLYATPRSSAGSSMTSNFATPRTPFTSPRPPTIVEAKDEDIDGEEMDEVVSENTLQLQWGASEKNGWRIDMEDAMMVKYPLYRIGVDVIPARPASVASSSICDTAVTPTMGIFGVFDGHGDGGYVSEFIARNLVETLETLPNWALAYHSCNSNSNANTSNDESLPLSLALTQMCLDLDEGVKNDASKPGNGGSTAIMAFVSDRNMFVANVGDSRCILVKKKVSQEQKCWEPSCLEIISMSEDHKPSLPEERSRIESAGLSVDECGRVKKSERESVGVARAFGDFDYKTNKELDASLQAVTCAPEIRVHERVNDEDMYLILGKRNLMFGNGHSTPSNLGRNDYICGTWLYL